MKIRNSYLLNSLAVVFLAFITALPGLAQEEPTKLALLVGINKYEHGISNLDGAVNDVEIMKNLLVELFGFPDDDTHIRVLTNNQATRKGILDAFNEHLINNPKLGPDSIVVFHYSGHGSQKLDVSGDETDRWDETLVPHDSGRKPHANQDITDDEINVLMARLSAKTPNVTFIFDSCHSGTATRGAGKARTVAPDDRQPAGPAATAMASTHEGRTDMRAGNVEYTLISGAGAKELAREKTKGERAYGALTWHLVDEMRKAALRKKAVTYSDIMDRVKLKVTASFPLQHPQLEVSGDMRYVFSARSRKTEPYVLGSKVPGGKVKLAAGQVHGVTKGSIYDVYAPDTQSFDTTAKSMAQLEVESVGVTESIAKTIHKKFRHDGSKVVEREHRFPDAQVRVHFMDLERSETLKAIDQELAQYKHIVRHDETTGYDLLLREEGGYIFTEAGDPSPLSPKVKVSNAAVGKVAKQVTHWAKWFGVLAIENHDPDLDVAFEVKKTSTRGGSSFMDQDVDLTMEVDDRFMISVTNNSSRDLYIAVLDLESDGSVSVVFPSTGNPESVSPGKSWTLEVKATLPQGRDRVRDVLKLFATNTPCRFDFLEQGPVSGTRGLQQAGGRKRNALEELLANGARGTTRGDDAPEVESWTTAELVLEVRR